MNAIVKRLIRPILVLILLLASSSSCTSATPIPTKPANSPQPPIATNPPTSTTAPTKIPTITNPPATTTPTSTTAPTKIPTITNPPATDTTPPTAGLSDIGACLDSLPLYPNAQEVSRDDVAGTRSYTSPDAEPQVGDYYRNNPIASNCTESPKSRADPGSMRMTCVNNNLNIIIYVHALANRQNGAAIDLKCEP